VPADNQPVLQLVTMVVNDNHEEDGHSPLAVLDFLRTIGSPQGLTYLLFLWLSLLIIIINCLLWDDQMKLIAPDIP
jgi:hypothetical protein